MRNRICLMGTIALSLAGVATGAYAQTVGQSTDAGDWQTLGLMRIRDMTPWGLARMDMLPTHAIAAPSGTFAFEFNLSYQNTWALSDNVLEYLESRGTRRAPITAGDMDAILALPGDAYLVDGEYGLIDLTLHYRFSSHWGAYVTVPYITFDGGFLDGTIEDFHDMFGFSTAGRDTTPRNRWQIIAHLQNAQYVVSRPPDNDFGDPVLGFRYSLKDRPDKWNLVVEAATKIPSGGPDFMVSTGEYDYGLQVSVQRFFRRNALYATVSGVYFGSPDVGLAEDQWIPTLILGWETRLSRHLNFILQTYASRSTVQRTDLDELTSEKIQATLGIQWLYRGNVLRFGITENLANFNNTPDIGVTLSIAHVFLRR